MKRCSVCRTKHYTLHDYGKLKLCHYCMRAFDKGYRLGVIKTLKIIHTSLISTYKEVRTKSGNPS